MTEPRSKIRVVAFVIVAPLLLFLSQSCYLKSNQYLVYDAGRTLQVEGRFSTTESVLKAAGVTVRPEDIVQPGKNLAPDPDSPIVVVHAREIILSRQGKSKMDQNTGDEIRHIWTQQHYLAAFLSEADEVIQPGDRIFVDGRVIQDQELADTPLSDRVDIVSQKEITLRENNHDLTVITTARNVGEALLEQGIRLNTVDAVEPPLGSWLHSGSVIEIHRAIPVTVNFDGQIVSARTYTPVVSAVIEELGINLEDKDYTTPNLSSSLRANDHIEVVRVREEYEISEEIIPYDSVRQQTGDLEIDQVAIIQQGVPGILQRRTLIQRENGAEISRSPVEEIIIQQPVHEVIGYGTKILVRTLDTPDGPIEYWRVVRMRVTAYTAASAGKPPTHPAYGITASGVPAGFGVVSIDPTIVPFRSYVYVPGYGKGFAGDTGGGVKGRFIDLGYDDGQIVSWNGYVDVYYLTPIPPADQINYNLPSTLP